MNMHLITALLNHLFFNEISDKKKTCTLVHKLTSLSWPDTLVQLTHQMAAECIQLCLPRLLALA